MQLVIFFYHCCTDQPTVKSMIADKPAPKFNKNRIFVVFRLENGVDSTIVDTTTNPLASSGNGRQTLFHLLTIKKSFNSDGRQSCVIVEGCSSVGFVVYKVTTRPGLPDLIILSFFSQLTSFLAYSSMRISKTETNLDGIPIYHN